MKNIDVLIIGAGAAGMMCAIEAGKRGRRVLLVDHAKKPGEKIRISGGGRCNFTNRDCAPQNFISANPHFVKSALAQYSAQDFIALVDQHAINWHEKTKGQLFCDNRAGDIINMLLEEMTRAGVELQTGTEVISIIKSQGGFIVETTNVPLYTQSVIIATGGKSIPKMGATGYGYEIAKQFGLQITPLRAALVPFTFDENRLQSFRAMAGISFDCNVSFNNTQFSEPVLFTHRGLSGPAMLQISSYWREGESINIEFVTRDDFPANLTKARKSAGRQEIKTWLATLFPTKLARFICEELAINDRLADLTKKEMTHLIDMMQNWSLTPAGTEGYRTAEVTLGGVDTNELNSRTLESKKIPGLYFIGEVVDVTGWLGGYNFQWAWSSGWAAGQVV